MTQPKIVMLSVAVTTLSLGFSPQPHPRPFWESNIVIAAEETLPGNVQTEEDSSAAKSAKMGKGEGTHTGGANQGTTAESDTQKLDRPPRKNPITGN